MPPLSSDLFDISIGMILGDATMYHVSRDASIKFEQGVHQKEFCFHLFDLFSNYCFMQQPKPRYVKSEKIIKSYWFKTFSFPDFTKLYRLFYHQTETKRVKIIQKGLITQYLTPKGFAFWIMCDGSLQKDGKTLILHTQNYTLIENTPLSNELNDKFNLHSRVIPHKKIYHVIEIPKQDSSKMVELVESFMIPSMTYKISRLKKEKTC